MEVFRVACIAYTCAMALVGQPFCRSNLVYPFAASIYGSTTLIF